MDKQTNPHHVLASRWNCVDAFQGLKSGWHVMYALLEVDATIARKFIEGRESETGEELSSTGYLISWIN